MIDKAHAVEAAKYVGDALSAGVALATLIKLLPALAALVTIVWTTIRILETRTVRGWLGKPPYPPND